MLPAVKQTANNVDEQEPPRRRRRATPVAPGQRQLCCRAGHKHVHRNKINGTSFKKFYIYLRYLKLCFRNKLFPVMFRISTIYECRITALVFNSTITFLQVFWDSQPGCAATSINHGNPESAAELKYEKLGGKCEGT